MKELPVIEAKERNQALDRLAGDIFDLYLSAQHKAQRTTELGRETVREVILCGKKMREAKKMIGHKKWLQWLRDNCPAITERTARNWMRLSKSENVSLLETCGTLSQAYRACGILPALAQSSSTEPAPITIESLLRWAGYAEKLQPEKFSGIVLEDKDREVLRNRLKPAHDAYLALSSPPS